MHDSPIKVLATIWISVTVAVLTAFGLIKLGANLFDVTLSDSEHCWATGGVPSFDTRGDSQDFTGCVYKVGR